MKTIVTCGPSFEPVDEVRRLTNSSTGELGALLAAALLQAGHEVFCLRGTGATYPGPAPAARCHVRGFDTNDDLLALLRGLATTEEIGAIFHAAALCDYRVARVSNESGADCSRAKIESRAGALTLRLEPATKVIASLRDLFPRARIVGWKYELTGTPNEALARARRQIAEARVDACVLNGRAAGEAFTICDAQGGTEFSPTKAALCAALAGKLA